MAPAENVSKSVLSALIRVQFPAEGNLKSFQNKVAVITGAGSGIGRELALQLAARGAGLALCDVDEPGLAETAEQLQGTPTKVHTYVADVANRQRMYALAGEVMGDFGQVDLLFNIAGVTLKPGYFNDLDDQQFDRVLDINMWGVYHGIRVFLPHLRQQPEAAIVNMSSSAGLAGLMGITPYAMSKFAVRGLSEALQMELVGSHISVTVVYPGGVKTNIMKNATGFASEEEHELANKSFMRGALTTRESAARQILRGVQKKRYRVIIGKDAKLVNFIRWLQPNRFPKTLNPIFKRMMFSETD
jgi:NAD(P)-dependent dehydrogenase (short-subunit alcohol dehydrogenase family)